MPFRFDQMPMERGLYAMVIDDGRDVWHVFTESEGWPTVREAMGVCADAYAEAVSKTGAE